MKRTDNGKIQVTLSEIDGRLVNKAIPNFIESWFEGELAIFERQCPVSIIKWLRHCSTEEISRNSVQTALKRMRFTRLGSEIGFAWLIQWRLAEILWSFEQITLPCYVRAVSRDCMSNMKSQGICVLCLNNDICRICPAMLLSLKNILKYYGE